MTKKTLSARPRTLHQEFVSYLYPTAKQLGESSRKTLSICASAWNGPIGREYRKIEDAKKS